MRGGRRSPVLAGEFYWVAQTPASSARLPHQHDKDDTRHLRKLNTKINKHLEQFFFPVCCLFVEDNKLQELNS